MGPICGADPLCLARAGYLEHMLSCPAYGPRSFQDPLAYFQLPVSACTCPRAPSSPLLPPRRWEDRGINTLLEKASTNDSQELLYKYPSSLNFVWDNSELRALHLPRVLFFFFFCRMGFQLPTVTANLTMHPSFPASLLPPYQSCLHLPNKLVAPKA